jgi:hypothetical protein
MGEFEPPDASEDTEFLEVRIPDEWEPGVYANASAVTFTTHEFTLDFIRVNPYHYSGLLVARIMLLGRCDGALAEPGIAVARVGGGGTL